MSIRVAISAFAHRGARRGTAASFLVYSAVLTVALVLLAAWISPEARLADLEQIRMWSQMKPPYVPTGLDPSLWTTLALSDVFALFTLGLGGFVLAPAMVAATVANERRVGTLDQLRTTPLSPLGHAAGMILGVPARLYLLCAGPLALHVVAAIVGPLPLSTLVASLAVLAAGTFASCALGLVVALAPRQEAGGTFAALGVAALLCVAALTTSAFACDRHMVAWSFLHPAGALDAVMLSPHGLWRRMIVGAWGGSFESERYRLALPLVPLASVAASMMFGGILLRAACRKLAAPERPLFGKRQAVALFVFAAAVVVGPLVVSGKMGEFDSNAAYGLTALLLPALVAVGLFATPTFEAWALALRSGARVRWSSDDAGAHRAVWLMQGVWALAVLALLGDHRLHAFCGDEPLALAWTALLALTLPIYFLFASTRYATLPGRIAFGVAVTAHLIAQMIAIGIVRGSGYSGFAGTYVTIAGVAALFVPAWTGWRQHVLKVRTLAR